MSSNVLQNKHEINISLNLKLQLPRPEKSLRTDLYVGTMSYDTPRPRCVGNFSFGTIT